MVKSLVKYFVSLFIGLVLIRLAFGQRLDRHLLVWYATFVVVLTLFVLVMPLTGEFFVAMKRRFRGSRCGS